MFKPMLAATLEDVAKLKFPLLASPKLDGVRAFVRDGTLYSRNLKPIPNRYVQSVVAPNGAQNLVEGMDGELIVGNAVDKYVFNQTSSGVMCSDKPCNVTFHVFDYCAESASATPFIERLEKAKKMVSRARLVAGSALLAVPHAEIKSADELLSFEEGILQMGFEGVMLRSPHGPYKWGRSTAREGYLFKLKRFADSEARIIGFTEQMSNQNTATIDELGRTKRSSHKAGKLPTDMLGNLIVRDLKTGVEFEIGAGFTEAQRVGMWARRSTLLDVIVKYKFFPVGVKDKPRFPVFIGFRHLADM